VRGESVKILAMAIIREQDMVNRRWRCFRRCSPLVLLGLIPKPALAHLVNTQVGEFYAGMMHPLTSAEHLLPTLALALLASQMGKQAARRVLLLFPATLAAGILLGYRLPHFALMQTINLLLLVALGGLLILAGSLPPVVAPVLAVATGLVLGYRSGVDLAAAAVGMQFIPGVSLTGLIIMALFAAWVPEASSEKGRLARGFLGAVFSFAGLVLLFFPLAGLDLQSIRSVGLPGPEDILSRIKSKELSPAMVFAALTGALVWGAGHALTPGHGKAIVAAYLVGARSTPMHAVYLGLTVTATHTLMVFALGLLTLLASRYILPEQLYPWLGLVSGLIVAGLGATMAITRFRGLAASRHHHLLGHSHPHVHDHGPSDHSGQAGHDHTHSHEEEGYSHDHDEHDHFHRHHDHDHSHDHHHDHLHDDHHDHSHSHLPPGAGNEPVTWQALLGLGISGGLLPCPAALVLLLTAVSLGRAGFGMMLVTVFSLGLAAVLITVGLLFIKGGRLLGKIPQVSGFSRWLPAVSSLVIFVIGVLITIQAAAQI
jgi:nickel/cobalt exporter